MRLAYELLLAADLRRLPDPTGRALLDTLAAFPVEEQGQSPFVWTVIGVIARASSSLRVFTAVTCPTIRLHPAIVAQAAATSAVLSGGRFGLRVGPGRR